MIADQLDNGELQQATQNILQSIAPKLTTQQLLDYSLMASSAAKVAGINTPKRLTAWLAQLAHESGGFRYLQEIWGPTPQQKRYGVGSLGKTLGNLEPGDGYKYRGRGWIQLTGRSNYKRYGDLLGIDLVGEPDLAADPGNAFAIAALFWQDRKLNELADKGAIRSITKSINGGYNGLMQRISYYRKAVNSIKPMMV
jgi:putative chitinase